MTCPRWYGQYEDSDGRPVRVALCRDKAAAQTMLADHIKESERRRAGLAVESDTLAQHARRTLVEHIADYERSLTARGRTVMHAQQTGNRLRRLADGCGFRLIADITAAKVDGWLTDRQDAELAWPASNSCTTRYEGMG